jgi:hypothetical protein
MNLIQYQIGAGIMCPEEFPTIDKLEYIEYNLSHRIAEEIMKSKRFSPVLENDRLSLYTVKLYAFTKEELKSIIKEVTRRALESFYDAK